jgi:hypothetical protein
MRQLSTYSTARACLVLLAICQCLPGAEVDEVGGIASDLLVTALQSEGLNQSLRFRFHLPRSNCPILASVLAGQVNIVRMKAQLVGCRKANARTQQAQQN